MCPEILSCSIAALKEVTAGKPNLCVHFYEKKKRKPFTYHIRAQEGRIFYNHYFLLTFFLGEACGYSLHRSVLRFWML